jgi:cyclopropane fatty-acyl-phospholipid synthase-like methyltransferase
VDKIFDCRLFTSFVNKFYSMQLLKNLFTYLVGLFFVSSAANAQHHSHNNGSKEDSIKKSSNEYMNQSTLEDLVQRFESPERDGYQQPEKVLAYLGNVKNKKIIDIGAGSGYFSVKLAKVGASVIAADVSDEFQEYLKRKIEKERIENIELRKIPYDSPALSNQEVDIAFMVNTYHHIENRVEYFMKVKSGIKREGELVIIDFFKSDVPVGPPIDHKISIDQVISELKAAGFTNFSVNVSLLEYQYIIKAY